MIIAVGFMTSACNISGQQNSNAGATSPQSAIAVIISPSSSLEVGSGGTQQFSVTVSGSANTSVTWSTSGGTVSASGLFTAPTVTEDTNASVIATSVADPTQSAATSVVVHPAISTNPSGPDNRYCGPGNVAEFGATMDGPAYLPTNCLYTALSGTPSPGPVTPLSSGSDLQSAINAAECGDTLSLEEGGVWTVGQLEFPAKSCDDNNWITIRTSAPDSTLPPEGTRLTPCYAGVSSLPGRPPLNCASTNNVLAKIEYTGTNSGPILFEPGANHYRFIGLEVTKQTASTFVQALASAVTGGSFDHVIFDRVWFHGDATHETTRGVQLDGSAYVGVIDSYFSDFHCIPLGKCTDSQAVSGGGGSFVMGPYKVVDNFLESSGENFILGGSGATYSPTDVEVRRNHFFKPMTWMPGQPGFLGVTFVVKNHFELKNAQRVLVEGNILDNNWDGAQSGFSVVLTPKNDGSCNVCEVTDVTFRYNTISHVGGAFQIANVLSGTSDAAKDGERYSIHDITADDISSTTYNGHGVFVQINTQITGTGIPLLNNVTIDHVTAFPNLTLINAGGPVAPKMSNFTFTNSIVNAGLYPVWSTGGGSANCAYPDLPSTSLNACFSPLIFSGNVIVAQPSHYTASMWPLANSFAPTDAAVGFVNFNNGNGGNYALSSTSPYKASGAGQAPGANISLIQQETSGVY
jgi:hypothetical protein